MSTILYTHFRAFDRIRLSNFLIPVLLFLSGLLVDCFSYAAQFQPIETKITYRYPRQHTLKIEGPLLGACFRDIVERTRNARFDDVATNYTDSFTGLPCSLNSSNFTSYLMATPERCDFETGQELRLNQWILRQPDNSINPVRIFSASLTINKGNVFDTVLTIHQLLRNHARWWDRDTYRFKSSTEMSNLFWNKFIDIRGNLIARGSGFHGDHEGSWYRIWAIILYRIYFNRLDSQRTNGFRSLSQMGHSTWNAAQAFGAELYKYLMPVFASDRDKRGKALVNSAAAQAAEALIFDYRNFVRFTPQKCLQGKYLQKTLFDY